MPSPFPGMDPYLEDPELWSGFRASFIAELQIQLSPLVRPDYFVRIEERVYRTEEDDPAYRSIVPDARVIANRRTPRSETVRQTNTIIAEPVPVVELLDDEMHEPRLEIRDRVDRSVVTVIELLSPTNKVAGSKGRSSFLQKRRETLASTAHWMEIDLLRGGVRTSNHSPAADTAYQVYLSRASDPRKAVVWPMALREPLPVVGVPLRGSRDAVPLQLQAILNQVYQTCGYDLDLEYGVDPTPPPPRLSSDDLQWVQEQLKNWHERMHG